MGIVYTNVIEYVHFSSKEQIQRQVRASYIFENMNWKLLSKIFYLPNMIEGWTQMFLSRDNKGKMVLWK